MSSLRTRLGATLALASGLLVYGVSAALAGAIPQPPGLVAPASGSTVTQDSSALQFSWIASQGAASYDVWVYDRTTSRTVGGTIPTFTGVLTTSTTAGDARISGKLVAGHGYWWWVRARNASGVSNWSAASTFYYSPASAVAYPAAPTWQRIGTVSASATANNNPIGAVSFITGNKVAWNSVPGATSYNLYRFPNASQNCANAVGGAAPYTFAFTTAIPGTSAIVPGSVRIVFQNAGSVIAPASVGNPGVTTLVDDRTWITSGTGQIGTFSNGTFTQFGTLAINYTTGVLSGSAPVVVLTVASTAGIKAKDTVTGSASGAAGTIAAVLDATHVTVTVSPPTPTFTNTENLVDGALTPAISAVADSGAAGTGSSTLWSGGFKPVAYYALMDSTDAAGWAKLLTEHGGAITNTATGLTTVQAATKTKTGLLANTTATGYFDTSFNALGVYSYAVEAVSNSGANRSALLMAASTNTIAGGSAQSPDAAPSAPSTVNAVIDASGTIKVTFTTPVGNSKLTTYTVYRGSSVFNAWSNGISPGSTAVGTYYEDMTASNLKAPKPGVDYYYAVMASNSAGKSTLSATVTTSAPVALPVMTAQGAVPTTAGGVMAAGDFDRDGNLDFVVADTAKNVNWYQGKGDGTFQAASVVGAVTGTPTAIAVADLQVRGVLDVVVVGQATALTAPASCPVAASGVGGTIPAGNYNSFATFSNALGETQGTAAAAAVTVAAGNKVTFGPLALSGTSINYYIETAPASGLYVLAATDTVGAVPQVVSAIPAGAGAALRTRNTTGAFAQVLSGAGDGTFTVGTAFGIDGTNPVAVSAKDLGAAPQKYPAIVVVDGTAAAGLNIYGGNGDGTFDLNSWQGLTTGVGANAVAVGATRTTLAPAQDLAVTNGSQVKVFLGNGDGTFPTTASRTYPVAGATGVAIGRLRLNSLNNDLVVGGTGTGATGKVSVFPGMGDGTFLSAVAYATSNPIQQVVIAEITSDANPDVVVRDNGATGTYVVSVLRGDGFGNLQAASSTANDYAGTASNIDDMVVGTFQTPAAAITLPKGADVVVLHNTPKDYQVFKHN